MARKPLTREQAIVKKLRQAAYTTRERRVEMVKDGERPYDHLDLDEFLEIIPGRRIAWLGELSAFTSDPSDPLWVECEAVVHRTTKRIHFDPETRILTFQDQEWCTRTIRVDRIFEITIRVIPEREVKKADNRAARKRQLTKRLAV